MKFGHIKNPLTVIAIFAGATELGGTYVLPHVTDVSNQRIYIWFLMLFPTYLISLFFFMLWHKHIHLYAPSDYSDENNFVAAGRQAVRDKIADEVVEATSDVTPVNPAHGETPVDEPSEVANESGLSPTADTAEYIARAEQQEYAHRLFIAEEYALSRLGAELGVALKRRVSPTNLRHLMFDAVKSDSDGTTVVEVRYTQTSAPNLNSYRRSIKNADAYYKTLSEKDRAKFKMIFVVVFERVREERIQSLLNNINTIALTYDFPIDVRSYELGPEADRWFFK